MFLYHTCFNAAAHCEGGGGAIIGTPIKCSRILIKPNYDLTSMCLGCKYMNINVYAYIYIYIYIKIGNNIVRFSKVLHKGFIWCSRGIFFESFSFSLRGPSCPPPKESRVKKGPFLLTLVLYFYTFNQAR